MNRREVN